MEKQNKENQSTQKGKRRHKLKDHQDNRGTKQNKNEYSDFQGNPIE